VAEGTVEGKAVEHSVAAVGVTAEACIELRRIVRIRRCQLPATRGSKHRTHCIG